MRHRARSWSGDDGVVAGRPTDGRVDDDPDGLVLHERERVGVEHALDVDLAEDLLESVEGEAGELGLDEVRSVLVKKCEPVLKKTCDSVSGVNLSNKSVMRTPMSLTSYGSFILKKTIEVGSLRRDSWILLFIRVKRELNF